MAGLLDMGVGAGDSVIVAPATGLYGGAAVPGALALGARVIACGRNAETLRSMAETFGPSWRFETVVLTGEVEVDTMAIKSCAGRKGADFYIDFIPPNAIGSTHIEACLRALRKKGRASFMGNTFGNVQIPYTFIMLNDIRIEGRHMFDREHGAKTVRLLEAGNLVVGDRPMPGNKMHCFELGEVNRAVEFAAGLRGWGNIVALTP